MNVKNTRKNLNNLLLVYNINKNKYNKIKMRFLSTICKMNVINSVRVSLNMRQITDLDKPNCKNCIYHIPNYSLGSQLSKCSYFGEKNNVSGEITYKYADMCRDDENKCGKSGKYFIEDKYADLKTTRNLIFQYSPVILFGSIIYIYIQMH
jgi:hypothetical protein